MSKTKTTQTVKNKSIEYTEDKIALSDYIRDKLLQYHGPEFMDMLHPQFSHPLALGCLISNHLYEISDNHFPPKYTEEERAKITKDQYMEAFCLTLDEAFSIIDLNFLLPVIDAYVFRNFLYEELEYLHMGGRQNCTPKEVEAASGVRVVSKQGPGEDWMPVRNPNSGGMTQIHKNLIHTLDEYIGYSPRDIYKDDEKIIKEKGDLLAALHYTISRSDAIMQTIAFDYGSVGTFLEDLIERYQVHDQFVEGYSPTRNIDPILAAMYGFYTAIGDLRVANIVDDIECASGIYHNVIFIVIKVNIGQIGYSYVFGAKDKVLLGDRLC